MQFGLQDNVVTDIKTILLSFHEIKKAVVYGSRAKGNYKTGSDIDLALIGDKLNTSTLNDISLKLDDLYLPYSFDLCVFSHIDNSALMEHINRIGIPLFAER